MVVHGDDNEEDEHYLSGYLQRRLPELGLDYETYGSYLMGLIDDDDDDDDDENAIFGENNASSKLWRDEIDVAGTATAADEEGGGEEGVDENTSAAWDDMLELLKGSSETHGEDESVWIDLKDHIFKLRREHRVRRMERDAAAREVSIQKSKEKLQREIELANQQTFEPDDNDRDNFGVGDGGGDGPGGGKEESAADAAKRALMKRYAYDDSAMYDESGNLMSRGKGKSGKDGGGSGGTDELSNRELAERVTLEKARETRSQFKASKKVEQEKTKEQRNQKERMKEERRKRTTKGERRR